MACEAPGPASLILVIEVECFRSPRKNDQFLLELLAARALLRGGRREESSVSDTYGLYLVSVLRSVFTSDRVLSSDHTGRLLGELPGLNPRTKTGSVEPIQQIVTMVRLLQ
jgi:hypothetical protein